MEGNYTLLEQNHRKAGYKSYAGAPQYIYDSSAGLG